MYRGSMPIEADDPRPPYVQLAAELRDAIADGTYEPGDRLPSTRQLAKDYGIAQMTAQHALRALQHEGLLVPHERRGYFVTERSETVDHKMAGDPQTLDEALKLLHEVTERLDRLEARVPSPHDPGQEPAAAPDVDL
jgi:DNA-binding GntR family transcriptional regulator